MEKRMRNVRTHTFNGRKYKISVNEGGLDGLCDTYDKGRELIICADLATRNGLITALHESLHASRWTSTEDTVDRVSREIGAFLWRLGYRKVDK